jgi:hypothetical protein
MAFARWVFGSAGIYGLAAILPQYFLEHQLGEDHPPPITHPVFYYGFIGVALAWQIAYLIIAYDPARFRPIIIPSLVEKASFGAAAIVLYLQNRTPELFLAAGIVDLVWGTLFLVAWMRTRTPRSTAA